LLFSVNLLAAKVTTKRTDLIKNNSTIEQVKCGEINVDGICSPVCDSVFKDITNQEEQVAKVKARFTGKCDEICSCICGGICDTVFGGL